MSARAFAPGRMSRVLGGMLTAAVLATGLAITPSGVPGFDAEPAAAKPHNPSDEEINQAEQDKAAKASEVGRLQGLVAKADGEMRRLAQDAELAGELYLKAEADYQRAADKAMLARASVEAAEKKVNEARTSVGEFARASYMQGSTIGSGMALLNTGGPSDLIERAGLLQSAANRHLDTVDTFEVASVAVANTESEARAAEEAAEKAKAKAAEAKRVAQEKVANSRQQLEQLTQQRASLEGQLVQAQARLSGLQTARQAYIEWKKEQERIARERAERLARERAEAERKAREAAEKAAAAEAAREAAEEAARQQAAQQAAEAAAAQAAAEAAAQQQEAEEAAAAEPAKVEPAPAPEPEPDPAPPPATAGGWTAEKGQAAVNAAMQWLGTSYAWAGGTPEGPSYGSAPDEGVLGFDCSGLTLYAWAQVGIYLDHYSGYQYTSGSHPSTDALMPGDLLFWSYDGTPGSIHHVAMYIGNGQVVQAPQSGDVVKVSSIWYDGLVGATRPGT